MSTATVHDGNAESPEERLLAERVLTILHKNPRSLKLRKSHWVAFRYYV